MPKKIMTFLIASSFLSTHLFSAPGSTSPDNQELATTYYNESFYDTYQNGGCPMPCPSPCPAPCPPPNCAPCAPASCGPCAPVCGTQCGISVCAIGAAIVAVAAAAAIVLVSGSGSTSH